MAATDSDLALLNSGSLRSDRIHPPGPFTLRDLNNILPLLNPLIVIEITGLPSSNCLFFVFNINCMQ